MTTDSPNVDITGAIDTFRAGRNPRHRYASFDYCYNYFQEAREAGDTGGLADDDRRQQSCLSSASTWRAGACCVDLAVSFGGAPQG